MWRVINVSKAEMYKMFFKENNTNSSFYPIDLRHD